MVNNAVVAERDIYYNSNIKNITLNMYTNQSCVCI